MTDGLLAIDPGTYTTGVALFEDGKLLDCGSIRIDSYREIERRIENIMDQLESYVGQHGQHIREVVAERPQGIDNYRPAPELQVLVRRLRRWGHVKPHKWAWTDYHPSTVVAAVRLRGMKGDTKTLIMTGVMSLYPQVGGAQAQDVYDAIAIGHCHITKTRVAALEGIHG